MTHGTNKITNTDSFNNTDEKERSDSAIRITWIGFFVNMVLSIGKVLAGFFGRSSAMLADGIHSLSDFITDLIVIVFIKIAGKKSDEKHKYGHGKYETFATLIISILLLVVTIGLFYDGAVKIIDYFKGAELGRPNMLALSAAVISIVTKEWLYQITVRLGRKINSQAVIANAWHHRSDAFSSIGTLLGISGAMFLGEQWRVLDPIACLIVSFFILKVSFELMMPALSELLESALPEKTEKEIGNIIISVDGIKDFHHLKTRKSGNSYIMDVHIKVDPAISIVEAHNIATDLENRLRSQYGNGTQISVHTEPYYAS